MPGVVTNVCGEGGVGFPPTKIPPPLLLPPSPPGTPAPVPPIASLDETDEPLTMMLAGGMAGGGDEGREE